MKKVLLCACASLMLLGGCDSNGQLMNGGGAMLGALGGAGVGAALGGHHPLVATLIGAGAGGVLGHLVQTLSTSQQQQRQAALQEAAAKPAGATTSWAAPRSASDRQTTKAKYVTKGPAKNDQGQTCTKVLETITLPDGKSGTSEELVCPT